MDFNLMLGISYFQKDWQNYWHLRFQLQNMAFHRKCVHDPSNSKSAFKTMVIMFDDFLGIERKATWKRSVEDIMESFEILGCNMSLKLHMLHSHCDVFINCVKVNDQHGERFHQDILPLEKRYKAKWTENMMGDYLWNILKESKTMCKRQVNSIQQP